MSTLNHSFSVEHAEKYGVDCAILIHHFQFWIEQNRKMKRNFHDGRTWMYQTQKELAAIMPYYSEDQIKRIIWKLLDDGVIVKGNYNHTAFDRTVWYAFKDEEIFTIRRNRLMDSTKSPNPLDEIAEPIPYTKQDAKQQQQQPDVDEMEILEFSQQMKAFCLAMFKSCTSEELDLFDFKFFKTGVKEFGFGLLKKALLDYFKRNPKQRKGFYSPAGIVLDLLRNQPKNG